MFTPEVRRCKHRVTDNFVKQTTNLSKGVPKPDTKLIMVQ